MCRYRCGSAREFFNPDGTQSQEQSMTCQWNRTWMPTNRLGTCEWVACLQPPKAPTSSNLRVTHWFGQPIPFGEQVKFVCSPGYYFEEDYHQSHVSFTCQDGSNPGFDAGYFDSPEYDVDWPRCVFAPLCPKPPSTPREGKREVISQPIPIDQYQQCSVNGEDIKLECHSFLNVYIKDTSYGRLAINGKKLCDGQKPEDSFAPSEDCFDALVEKNITKELRDECAGQYKCTWTVPTFYLSPACEGKMIELRTNFICGK